MKHLHFNEICIDYTTHGNNAIPAIQLTFDRCYQEDLTLQHHFYPPDGVGYHKLFRIINSFRRISLAGLLSHFNNEFA